MIEKLQGYYAILDIKEASTDLNTLWERAEILLSGNPCCLQLRAKALETAQWMECARQLQALCRARDVLFVVNDRLDVGLALDVDGVHLGQEDLGLRQALSLRGQKARPMLGISTHDLAQAQDAANLGADYLGFGPVFPTRSKREAGSARGVFALAQVVLAVSIPVVAIGGITLENVDAVVSAGACAAAVIAAVDDAPDPAAVGRAIGESFKLLRPKRI
jgi:thiamine-phosphate diphosphorylase